MVVFELQGRNREMYTNNFLCYTVKAESFGSKVRRCYKILTNH